MKKVKGVKRYAKQFVSTVDLNDVPQGIEHLSAVAKLMEEDRNFRNLMVSPIFSESEGRQVVTYISDKLKMGEKTAKYLQYLLASKVVSGLPEIISAITSQYREMMKRTKAVIASPSPIGGEYAAKLAGSLKQLTGRDVDLEFVIDPSLLGGVCIKIGSTMYDSSIKGQLGLLRDKLIKG